MKMDAMKLPENAGDVKGEHMITRVTYRNVNEEVMT